MYFFIFASCEPSINNIYIYISGVQGNEPRGTHSILTEELLANYGPTSARPVRDVDIQIDVTIQLQIQRVIELVSSISYNVLLMPLYMC